MKDFEIRSCISLVKRAEERWEWNEVWWWWCFVFSSTGEVYIFEVMLAKSTEDHSNRALN